MRRRVLIISAFAFGIVASPFFFSLITATQMPAIAQEEDLIVVEPPARAGIESGVGLPNNDLIAIQQGERETHPQQVYLNLVKQKIQMISAEQLEQETEQLRRELAELEATKKLSDAERTLQDVIDQHPRSAAATKARSMLDTLRQSQDLPMDRDSFDNAPRARSIRERYRDAIEDGFESLKNRRRAPDPDENPHDERR